MLIAPAAAVLVNCFDAFVEMPLQMLGRPILYKQTNFKFFRPSALPLADTLADIPFSFSRILVFNIIVSVYSHDILSWSRSDVHIYRFTCKYLFYSHADRG